jgi:S1-C subfamily serine protease
VTDVGVLDVPRTHLPTLKFQPALPPVGALDIVVGSPLGLTESVTAGIISGLHRNMPPTSENPLGSTNLIQTDAPISPGNSGGAVVDVQREVLGLSEAYIPPQLGAVAIGFVTPAQTVMPVADQILAHGTATHAFLGVQLADATLQEAHAFGMQAGAVFVVSVVPHSPADRAGLRPGDIITAFNGQPISSTVDLLALLRQLPPGTTVTIKFVRNGHPDSTKVMLGSQPQ